MRCLLALTVYHTPRQRGALFVCFSLFITVTPHIRKGTSAGTPFVGYGEEGPWNEHVWDRYDIE